MSLGSVGHDLPNGTVVHESVSSLTSWPSRKAEDFSKKKRVSLCRGFIIPRFSWQLGWRTCGRSETGGVLCTSVLGSALTRAVPYHITRREPFLMPIEFRCPQCNKRLRTPDSSAGKTAKCPSCSNPVTVPATSTIAPNQPDGASGGQWNGGSPPPLGGTMPGQGMGAGVAPMGAAAYGRYPRANLRPKGTRPNKVRSQRPLATIRCLDRRVRCLAAGRCPAPRRVTPSLRPLLGPAARSVKRLGRPRLLLRVPCQPTRPPVCGLAPDPTTAKEPAPWFLASWGR